MDDMKENAIFQPSPEQLGFAEIWLDYTKKKTLESIAEEIGIAYSTIWRWFQNKDFVDWINSRKDELLNKSLMSRYRTAIRKAESGDFQFSKLLFEIQGEYIPQQKLGGMEDKPININLIPVSNKSDIEKLKDD
jgi:transcriptional regulator with XRE-family HTH domain